MTSLGLRISLLIGRGVPVPALPLLTQALERVEVTETDEGRGGFQLVFNVDRRPPLGVLDYAPLAALVVEPFSRVVIVVTFAGRPHVLFDGVVTHHELDPGVTPGKLVVTGEDLGRLMDLEERVVPHPGLSEDARVRFLLLRYTIPGLIPMIIPPPTPDLPNPSERVPVQHASDLEYIEMLARRHGYVFSIEPGPVAGTSVAYWGPPRRGGLPQRALSANMGSLSNIETIRFFTDSLRPTRVLGQLQDSRTNAPMLVATVAGTRVPLAAKPEVPIRVQTPTHTAGGNSVVAMAHAQATTNRSLDEAVTAEGELDAMKYGAVLRARRTVGVRGVGLSHGGNYYVKKVVHKLEKGSYQQRFTLTREGRGTLTPVVIP